MSDKVDGTCFINDREMEIAQRLDKVTQIEPVEKKPDEQLEALRVKHLAKLEQFSSPDSKIQARIIKLKI